MTKVELDVGESAVLDAEGVRALLGRLTRPDGRPISRGTLNNLIAAGLPAHRLVDVPRGRYHFYEDEIRGYVGNRWNRRTPAHRQRHPSANGDDQ